MGSHHSNPCLSEALHDGFFPQSRKGAAAFPLVASRPLKKPRNVDLLTRSERDARSSVHKAARPRGREGSERRHVAARRRRPYCACPGFGTNPHALPGARYVVCWSKTLSFSDHERSDVCDNQGKSPCQDRKTCVQFYVVTGSFQSHPIPPAVTRGLWGLGPGARTEGCVSAATEHT